MPWIAGQLLAPISAEKWLPAVGGEASVTVAFRRLEAGSWIDYTAVPKVWTGSAWIIKRPRRWDGSAWVGLS